MFSNAPFEKIFDLPVNAAVQVAVDQRIQTGDLLFLEQKTNPPAVILAAALLDIDPQDIMHCMVKKIGEPVQKNEILAQKGRLPVLKTVVTAPIAGTVETIDESTGTITIRQEDSRITSFFSPINGKVVSASNRTLTLIADTSTTITGAFGGGDATYGTFDWIEKYLTTPTAPHGTYIFGVNVWSNTVEQFIAQHSEHIGGIIAAAIPLSWITSNNDTIPFIVTEGIGDFEMSTLLRSMLDKNVSQTISLFPETKVYAGAIRPQIIAYNTSSSATAASTVPFIPQGSARLLRTPYLGIYGLIENRTDKVCTLKTEYGNLITAPLQNVEIF